MRPQFLILGACAALAAAGPIDKASTNELVRASQQIDAPAEPFITKRDETNPTARDPAETEPVSPDETESIEIVPEEKAGGGGRGGGSSSESSSSSSSSEESEGSSSGGGYRGSSGSTYDNAALGGPQGSTILAVSMAGLVPALLYGL